MTGEEHRLEVDDPIERRHGQIVIEVEPFFDHLRAGVGADEIHGDEAVAGEQQAPLRAMELGVALGMPGSVHRGGMTGEVEPITVLEGPHPVEVLQCHDSGKDHRWECSAWRLKIGRSEADAAQPPV